MLSLCFKIVVCTESTTQAIGIAVPSVAASMIASLHEKPSQEDELTSRAVPATMYIGKLFRLSLSLAYEVVRCVPNRWSRYSKSADLLWIIN